MRAKRCSRTRSAWALALVLPFVCMAARAQSDTWKTYSYPADGFSINAPAEPQMIQQDEPTAGGASTLRNYYVSFDNGLLGAGIYDFGSSLNGRDPRTVVDEAMNNAVAADKGHILWSSRIMIGTNQGNSFEAENDHSHISGRVYLVGSVLYQLFVIMPLNQHFADTARFLDSFQLIPRSQD